MDAEKFAICGLFRRPMAQPSRSPRIELRRSRADLRDGALSSEEGAVRARGWVLSARAGWCGCGGGFSPTPGGGRAETRGRRSPSRCKGSPPLWAPLGCWGCGGCAFLVRTSRQECCVRQALRLWLNHASQRAAVMPYYLCSRARGHALPRTPLRGVRGDGRARSRAPHPAWVTAPPTDASGGGYQKSQA